ncbi:MAG: hypothetical protein NTY08_04335 [Proteobacteria bacterium]|nr:hypothetical protein [Pseudomonadota bacterium]
MLAWRAQQRGVGTISAGASASSYASPAPTITLFGPTYGGGSNIVIQSGAAIYGIAEPITFQNYTGANLMTVGGTGNVVIGPTLPPPGGDNRRDLNQ